MITATDRERWSLSRLINAWPRAVRSRFIKSRGAAGKPRRKRDGSFNVPVEKTKKRVEGGGRWGGIKNGRSGAHLCTRGWTTGRASLLLIRCRRHRNVICVNAKSSACPFWSSSLPREFATHRRQDRNCISARDRGSWTPRPAVRGRGAPMQI